MRTISRKFAPAAIRVTVGIAVSWTAIISIPATGVWCVSDSLLWCIPIVEIEFEYLQIGASWFRTVGLKLLHILYFGDGVDKAIDRAGLRFISTVAWVLVTVPEWFYWEREFRCYVGCLDLWWTKIENVQKQLKWEQKLIFEKY